MSAEFEARLLRPFLQEHTSQAPLSLQALATGTEKCGTDTYCKASLANETKPGPMLKSYSTVLHSTTTGALSQTARPKHLACTEPSLTFTTVATSPSLARVRAREGKGACKGKLHALNCAAAKRNPASLASAEGYRFSICRITRTDQTADLTINFWNQTVTLAVTGLGLVAWHVKANESIHGSRNNLHPEALTRLGFCSTSSSQLTSVLASGFRL